MHEISCGMRQCSRDCNEHEHTLRSPSTHHQPLQRIYNQPQTTILHHQQTSNLWKQSQASSWLTADMISHRRNYKRKETTSVSWWQTIWSQRISWTHGFQAASACSQPGGERKVEGQRFQGSHQQGKTMIMKVKTPGSQMGSPAAADKGGEEMGGEKCESGERREVQARSTVASTVASTVSKARSRSREVVTLDEEPRISLSVNEIAVIVIVVDVDGHHSARTYIGMPVYDGGIRANICILVDTVKARGGTASPENFQFASIRGHQIVHPHNFSSEKKTILRLQWSKTRNTCRADCKRCNWYGQNPGQYDTDFCTILFININVGHLYMYWQSWCHKFSCNSL